MNTAMYFINRLSKLHTLNTWSQLALHFWTQVAWTRCPSCNGTLSSLKDAQQANWTDDLIFWPCAKGKLKYLLRNLTILVHIQLQPNNMDSSSKKGFADLVMQPRINNFGSLVVDDKCFCSKQCTVRKESSRHSISKLSVEAATRRSLKCRPFNDSLN